jgi:hypothetical protein
MNAAMQRSITLIIAHRAVFMYVWHVFNPMPDVLG